MRVSTQLAIASLVAVLAVGAIGFGSHLYVRALERDADEIAEEWNEMDAITGALAVLRRSHEDPARDVALRQQSERLAGFAEQMESDGGADAHEHSETRMFRRLSELLDRAAADGADADALADEAEALALTFWKEDIGRVPERLSKIRKRQRRLRSINIATGVVLLLVPALVLLFIHGRVARPLARIQARVDRLGERPAEGHGGLPAMARLEKTIDRMAESVEAQRRELEAEVATRTEQLHHANRLGGLGRISAAVAHEINTPLGSIALSVQGLQRALSEDPLPREEIEGYLKTAESQIEACTATTRKLLSYAHLKPQESRATPVAALVQEALELVQPHFRRRGVRVEPAVDRATPGIRGDVAQLRQVLVNLLLNAADASPPGDVVEVVARARADGAEILVRDHGPGIPAETRDAIFHPFFTTKRVGEGTGLGLSIAREIVEVHGGELTLLDEGPGATFRVVLPPAGVPAP